MCRSHLPAVFFCGYAFCGRLNPPLPNDAFMLPVSPRASLRLPPTLSRLIKRMGQYASDIKRHQSPRAVYLPRLCLSFALSLSPLAFFFSPPSYAKCLQTPFDAGYPRVHLLRSAVVSVEQANQPASLSVASGSSPLCIATLYVTCDLPAMSRGFRRKVLTRQMATWFARRRAFFFIPSLFSMFTSLDCEIPPLLFHTPQ